MGVRKTITTKAAGAAASAAAPVAAPLLGRQLLDRAVEGFPGFPGAREVARKHLERKRDVDAAVRSVIDQHVRLAGAQGFLTNLGGLAMLPLTMPANITGLALLHARQVAAIAHLRGHELGSPRVRAAVLSALLGRNGVEEAISQRLLPGSPYEILGGTGPLPDGFLDKVSRLVLTSLTQHVTGKRVALVVTRRIPIIGGGVGGAIDALTLHGVGRFASEEFPVRMLVEIDAPPTTKP